MENTKIAIKQKIKKIINNFFKNDIKNKLFVAYLIINLLYMLIGSYIFFTGIIENFKYKEFAIGLKYLFIANCIVLFAIIIHKWRKKDLKCFKRPIYLGVLLCIIFGIISTIFAYDTNIALEGCWGRYEGLFSILYYLTIMILSTFVYNKYKKILVKVILICGAIQAVYAIFQIFSLFNVKQYFHIKNVYFDNNIHKDVFVKELWALGFTNNPNFLGTYMVLCLSYSFGLFINTKKKIGNIVYSMLSILFMFGLLISNTLAVVIGLFLVVVYIFIYCLKNKYYEKFIVVLAIILSTTCLAVALGKTTIVKDIIKTGKETTEIAKGNLDDNYGSKRMYIWKETLKIVPENLLHGVGIDSFHKAFNGEALILQQANKRIIYDKAHNEYLQTLVTQGIFALASYLFVYGYTVYYGIKTSKKTKQIYLVLPVIGYLVQAFFNISVIEVAPIFYIALGLCCGKEPNEKGENV